MHHEQERRTLPMRPQRVKRMPGASGAAGRAGGATALVDRPSRHPVVSRWLTEHNYTSIAEAAAERGVPSATVRSRLRRGIPPAEAFGPVPDDERGASAIRRGLCGIVALVDRIDRADPAATASAFDGVEVMALRDALDVLRARVGAVVMAQVWQEG